jgi:hypothetical protein
LFYLSSYFDNQKRRGLSARLDYLTSNDAAWPSLPMAVIVMIFAQITSLLIIDKHGLDGPISTFVDIDLYHLFVFIEPESVRYNTCKLHLIP